ncbi:MAG: transcription antitermination factor NusB [Acutalibacteraceae bacterium]
MTRHESREAAFIIIFEKMFNAEKSVEEIIVQADESGVFKTDEFSKNLAKTTVSNEQEIDNLINENLVRWSPDRIARVPRAILRMAVGEIKYSDIPVAVAINEAVELAKKYAEPRDASFINGLLASVAGKVRE